MRRVNIAVRAITTVAAIVVVVVLSSGNVLAQESEWSRLNRDAVSLSKQGPVEQAKTVANQALAVAEKTFGPDHANVATSLNLLGVIYHNERQYQF